MFYVMSLSVHKCQKWVCCITSDKRTLPSRCQLMSAPIRKRRDNPQPSGVAKNRGSSACSVGRKNSKSKGKSATGKGGKAQGLTSTRRRSRVTTTVDTTLPSYSSSEGTTHSSNWILYDATHDLDGMASKIGSINAFSVQFWALSLLHVTLSLDTVVCVKVLAPVPSWFRVEFSHKDYEE